MPWSRTQFEAELHKSHAKFLVLTDDETDSVVVGYIVYWVQVEGASLLNVCVAPKFRGLGFGEQLVRTMIKDVVREEIPCTRLEVRASNQAAISLYQRIGFKKTHEREKFYSDGETADVMELKTSDLSPEVH